MELRSNNPPKFDLFELPLISEYRVTTFHGLADGTELTRDFNIDSLQDRYIVLKSIQLVPYAAQDIQDFFVSDGTTINTETMQLRMRLTRVIDNFGNAASIVMKLNGVPVGIFNQVATSNYYPMDLRVDNIYYFYPEKIQDFTLAVTGQVINDLQANTGVNPNITVVVELYLI